MNRSVTCPKVRRNGVDVVGVEKACGDPLRGMWS